MLRQGAKLFPQANGFVRQMSTNISPTIQNESRRIAPIAFQSFQLGNFQNMQCAPMVDPRAHEKLWAVSGSRDLRSWKKRRSRPNGYGHKYG